MASNAFAQLVKALSREGRNLLRKYTSVSDDVLADTGSCGKRLEALCRALLGAQGEASGVTIAADLLDCYFKATEPERLDFFRLLNERYSPDLEQLRRACGDFGSEPSPSRLRTLTQAVEPPRKELFRRLNLAPGATAKLVQMRGDLVSQLKAHPDLSVVDDDLLVLLQSWFSRGFLELRRLSWSSSADILERIIRYESVHSIRDWDDLRSRIDPPDRRCFAFFHPAMPDEPLIFVEVALTTDIPDNILGILDASRPRLDVVDVKCAVFYSISNCQKGLLGVSFGNFLIKQVVADLSHEMPQLRTFVTLSPAPGFLSYLKSTAASPDWPQEDRLDTTQIEALSQPGWWEVVDQPNRLKDAVLRRALHYFLDAKIANGKPLDPVARFHLGNGARLERLNWLADRSEPGLRQSGGLMVNYLYDLAKIEHNHEAHAYRGLVVTGRPIRQLVKSLDARGGSESKRRYLGLRAVRTSETS